VPFTHRKTVAELAAGPQCSPRAVECGWRHHLRHKRCGHWATDADPRRQDFEGAMAVPAEVLKSGDRVIE
jgi:hypothetical protein